MNCLILAALLVFMQAPSQLAGMVIETPTNEIHVVQLPSDWSPHKDWFDYIGWGAGVMLAFAGVIGVCFAYRTLRTLQHQTIATRKAAEAARLNAQAVINAERPWVVVTEKREGTAGIASIFYSRVRGRTPAIIISNWADHIYVDDPQHLPIPPRYEIIVTIRFSNVHNSINPPILLTGSASLDVLKSLPHCFVLS